MAHINYAPNPVEQAYGGGDALNVRKLHEFCNTVSGNFTSVNAELAARQHTYAKLLQFMNWLAVTNPQILDEFQSTANAFEKLSPRSEEGGIYPQSSAQSV